MKVNTLAMIAGICLAGVSVQADDKDVNKGAPPGQAGEDTSSTTGKIKQGAKNAFTEMKFEDLPPAVQATVRQQSGGTKISDIDREDRTGKTIFEVEFEKDGDNKEIHVAEDGTLVPEDAASLTAGNGKDSTDRTRVRASMSPKFSDLPAAVQQTVQQHGAQSEIEDIDRETHNGKNVYEIEFRREGANREIVVAEDGTLIKQENVPGVNATPAPRPATPPANEVK